ncbi:kelch domain-containing protein 3-like isoform X2 [Anneissia japonica]|uniref:kelch domain-containing protein 3-like isoform X2 n=1 Tax=Anneissia japonica TaxID=1529436 RepID=UPI0014255F42|nr:kelch domain-containing protein 3-like isoform X2 [Anneissia japonica]
MPMWTLRLEGGPRRVNHAAAAVNHLIFSFGGYCTGDDYARRRPMDVHVFNIETLQWRKLPDVDSKDPSFKCIPFMRYGHSAVAYNDNIYIFGGRNDPDGACNELFCFQTASLKWCLPKPTGDIPPARDGHSVCLVKNKMYIFGGYEDLSQCFSNSIHRLNIDKMKWKRLTCRGNAAYWRDFHSAVAIGQYMFIFGGRSDKNGQWFSDNEFYSNKLEVFDTKSKTWSAPETWKSVPVGRRSHSAFVYCDNMYIFGGYNRVIDEHFNTLHKLDTKTMDWSKVQLQGSLEPCKRRRQCCVTMGSRVVMFGGTSPKPKMQADGTDDDNLQDMNDLFILDFEPSLKTLCQLAVIKYNLDTAVLPKELRMEIRNMVPSNLP